MNQIKKKLITSITLATPQSTTVTFTFIPGHLAIGLCGRHVPHSSLAMGVTEWWSRMLALQSTSSFASCLLSSTGCSQPLIERGWDPPGGSFPGDTRPLMVKFCSRTNQQHCSSLFRLLCDLGCFYLPSFPRVGCAWQPDDSTFSGPCFIFSYRHCP